jgi:hypothetical protein
MIMRKDNAMLLKLGKQVCLGYCLLLVHTLYGEPIRTGDDAQKLVASLENKLQAALKQQIKHVERESGKKFAADEELIGQQGKALKLLKAVVPKITKGVVTELGGEKAQMHVLGLDKIEKLSSQELAKVLKSLADSLKMLPPVKDLKGWAKALAPLVSFDGDAQALMTTLLGGWFDALLKNKGDLKKLAEILTSSKGDQRGLVPLRKKYEGIQHNISQCMYTLLQVILITHNRNPWEVLLDLATNKPQELGAQLKELSTLLRSILEKVQPDGGARTDELLLAAITTLFAPNEFFALLSKNKAS